MSGRDTQSAFPLGQRVRFIGTVPAEEVGGSLLGTVVAPVREWGERQWDPAKRTPVNWDGDDHISSALTEALQACE